MELRHLRYFVAIAEEQSFRRAALRLHVSQSPLSRQMQDLEHEMGIELFQPDGRGVKLTEAGKAFEERARAILVSVDAAVDEAKGVAEGRLGNVTIGFETGTTFMGVFLSLVAAFRRHKPLIGLQLVPLSSVEQWAALARGTIAFGYGAYAPSDKTLGCVEMTRVRLGVLLSRDHHLARLKKVHLRDLERERILLQPRTLYPRLHADLVNTARSLGVNLRVTAEVIDLEALMALVALGDAVTFVGENMSDMATQASMVWRPVAELRIHLSEFVTWRLADGDTPVVRALIECAREVSPKRGSKSSRLASKAD